MATQDPADSTIPRFELDIEGGRILIVYAASREKAILQATKSGYLPKDIREAGEWNQKKCETVGDPREVTIIGDVYARPQKAKGK